MSQKERRSQFVEDHRSIYDIIYSVMTLLYPAQDEYWDAEDWFCYVYDTTCIQRHATDKKAVALYNSLRHDEQRRIIRCVVEDFLHDAN